MAALLTTRRLILAVSLVLGLALLPSTTTGSTAAAASSGPEVGAQWHALWDSETDTTRARETATLKQYGAQWVRIDVGWSMIEPNRGSYDTGWGVPFVEAAIDQARANGMKVLITFWRTPGWANGWKGATTPPTDPADYADALAWLVKRWKGKVSAWEIWNEPNLSAFWSGADPVTYTRLLRSAYQAAKAADPATTIVFGGTMYVDTDWISRAYSAGAKDHFDAMAVHPYQGYASAPPEAVDVGNRARMMSTDALVSLMKSKGDGSKPIWFTEFGWSAHSNTSSTPVWELGVTEAQQADYLRRSVELARSRWPQVQVMLWYNSRDKSSGSTHTTRRGLMRRDFTPRPALAALRDSVNTGAPAPSGPSPDVLVGPGATWSYKDDGSYVSSSWLNPSFDDSSWRRGSAPFGYGDGYGATALAPKKLNYVFRNTFDVSDPSAYESLLLKATRDDGIVVWLNGKEVWRNNMASGSVSNTTSSTKCAAGLGETEVHNVTIPGSTLVQGRNVFAVSLHNCSTLSSDARLSLEVARG